MARYRTRPLCMLLLTLTLSGFDGAVAAAQAPPAQRAGTPESSDRRPGAGARREDEEVRAAMEQVMLVRLRKALRLSPEQESRVMPRVQRLLDSRRGFAVRRRSAVSHLRALLIDETAAEPEIERGLREVKTIDEEFRTQENVLRRDIDRDLSPAQQARMYLFADQFRRSMQRRLQEARDRRRGGPPQPGAETDRRPGERGEDAEEWEDPEP